MNEQKLNSSIVIFKEYCREKKTHKKNKKNPQSNNSIR